MIVSNSERCWPMLRSPALCGAQGNCSLPGRVFERRSSNEGGQQNLVIAKPGGPFVAPGASEWPDR